MKKAILALFASLALALSTVSLASTAQAAAYPSSVVTFTSITGPTSVAEGKRFTVNVRVRSGNGQPNDGRVRVIFAGKVYSKPVASVTRISVVAPKVSRTTTKTLKAYFVAADGSVFK